MKRTLLISLATVTCFVVACAQRSDLEKKGRRQSGGAPQEKMKDFTAPDQADSVSMLANQPLARKIILGDKEVDTTIFCTDNLAANLKRPERIKIQGQSQVMVRQTKTQKNSERDEAGNAVDSQGIFNILCTAPSADLTQLVNSNKDHVLSMVSGQKQTLSGKFSMSTEDSQQVVIGCAGKDDLAMASTFLSSEDTRIRLDFMMAPKSKIILATDKGVVLLTCEQNGSQQALGSDNNPDQNPNGEVDPDQQMAKGSENKPNNSEEKPSSESSTQETTSPKDEMHQGGERTEEPKEGRAADINAGVNVND